jgi:hypothetical protein
MIFTELRSSLTRLSKFLMALMMGMVLALGVVPKPALAFDVVTERAATPQSSPIQIALAASSRFAAPSDEELEIQKMTERRREELREKRRQWQNQASEAAVEEAEEERAAKEAAEKKLNLEEIAEENPVTN